MEEDETPLHSAEIRLLRTTRDPKQEAASVEGLLSGRGVLQYPVKSLYSTTLLAFPEAVVF
jgi:hypothetical protein